MTIRRAKPIARGATPIKRSRLKQGKGAKAERETPALDAFRFAVWERARGYCEVMVISDPQKPFPDYDAITSDDRRKICGVDKPHRGDCANHAFIADKAANVHDPGRGLWLCWNASRYIHAEMNRATAARLGFRMTEKS